VSLVGYMSAGAFLGLQYFDLFYHLVAIIVVTRVLLQQRFQEEAKTGVVAGKSDASQVKDNQPPRARAPRRGTAILGENR
jgi:hypothetical protein